MSDSTDWLQLRLVAKDRLVSLPKTAKNRFIESLQSMDNADDCEIAQVLISCYGHYFHSDTRNVVYRTLKGLMEGEQRSQVASSIGKLAASVGQVKMNAVNDYMVVLDWVCMAIPMVSNIEDESKVLKPLIESQAVLLYRMLSHSDRKARIASTAERTCKSSIIKAIQAKSDIVDIYCNSLIVKSHSQAVAHLTLLGTLAGAATDLASKVPAASHSVEQRKPEIIDLYTQAVLGTKVPLEESVVDAFVPFFSDYANQQDFDEKLLPSITKAVLRAPEAVLPTIVPSLFGSLSLLVDLTAGLDDKLQSFLGTFTSSKPQVRDGGLNSLLAGITHCYGDLSSIADKVITAVKKVSNPDQKVLYAKLLNHMKCSDGLSSTVPKSVLPLATKETNEAVLKQYTEALFKHFIFGLEQQHEPNAELVEAIKKALVEKKLNVRKVWICSFVKSTGRSKHDLTSFTSTVLPTLRKSFDEVLGNVPTALQNKFLPAALAYVTLAGDSDKTALQSALSSQLISTKVFTKLTGDDLYWGIQANRALISEVGTADTTWCLAWIYYCLSKNVSVDLRRTALVSLRELYAEHPDKVGPLVIHTITDLLAQKTGGEDEALIPVDGLNTLITYLFAQYSQLIMSEQVESHLADAAIICHHPKVRPSSGWIGLVQKAGVDPGQLVSKHYTRVLEKVASTDKSLFDAACAAMATCCFINPDLVSPKAVELVSSFLDLYPVDSLTDFDVKVWNTPEGQIAVEEEENKKQYVENKNTKDYETKKWEESIRKKQAAAAPKKLTKEEQAKLAEQAQTRSKVQCVAEKLESGLQLVKAISKAAENVDNGVNIWFHQFVKLLDELLKNAKSDKLVGKQATSAFIQLSHNLSERLGEMRPFIAICQLRALYNATHLEQNLVEEPLKDLADRVLYRLKFLSDQRPLDSVTLIFVVPLLLQAIKFKGGIGTKKEDELEEQIILALGIITTHAEEFQQENTPRAALLTSLIQLMQKNPSKAKSAKEALLSTVQNIAVNYSNDELNILLGGFLSGDVFVRTTLLEAVDAELDISTQSFRKEVWIAKFDDELVNRDLAADIWSENELELTSDAADAVIGMLHSEHNSLRKAAARSLAAIVGEQGSEFHSIYEKLVALYAEMVKPPAPVYDRFGIEVKVKNVDSRWYARSGVAVALENLAPYYDSETLRGLFEFMINGATPALNDKNSQIASEMQQAGLEVIRLHGLKNIELLIPVFETYLERPDKETSDQVSQSTIILYGALARHLKSDDDRLTTIVDRLMATLSSPSEDVQFAISGCIPPLVPLFQTKLQSYFDRVIDTLFNESSNLAQRRGAAYGLAGLVKGAGISALSDYFIIRTLTDAVEDKKDPKKRQGAQFAFECLSQALGKFFEPYVIELLPLILSCLGDRDQDVREATNYTARMVMKNTTGYGVKQLIPLALENLDNTAWRAKKGSVELLGTMAYLEPRQLSTSLSTIIPELVGVLNDTHKEVRNAANQALKRFGEVIRNPEIQLLVPTLIKAIGDPTKYTDEALEGLLKTQFIHYIDAPSLALVVHVLNRGLKDRSASTKKKACQIVGNMSILTDADDLVPYLDNMVNELQVAMVDPVPGTRATASRALGALVEKLGEEQFPHLISDLMAVLRDENRAGDRLGSAQALSEILFGLGIRKLEELLPVILKNCSSTKPWIREGFMPLMIYLPNCFGASLSPYLNQIIPPILTGLADSVDGVRDTALKAGRLLVRNYSNKAVDLLLPELERGLSDINYRIRLSSVELTGDLLYQVTGISSSGGDEQDSAVAGRVSKTLGDVLGEERRARILAALFVCRSDVSGQVRTASIEVWKSLVANTPRTVKEILPVLTQIVIRRLASSEEEHRSIGAATLGELVRRVGANALSELLPTLEQGLTSSDPDAKQGICIALSELISSASEESLQEYQPTIVKIVRETLVDSDADVREAAAGTFEVLQDTIGNAAVDQILPHLIAMMQDESGGSNAFAALKEMMATKSEVVFPILIPTLLAPPMDSFKASALGSLATVSGTALYKRLTSIINAMVDALCTGGEQPEIDDALDTVLLSVIHDEGVHILMQHLISLGKNEDNRKREITFRHMAKFFAESSLDYSMYVQDWVSMLIYALDERDDRVVKGAWSALSALVTKTPKNQLLDLVKTSKNALSQTGKPGTDLAGFALPKGPTCILPVFLQGLMYGSNDERENSALGIADIVERTSVDILKPLVTQMTGPLIRTIGDRFPSDVKAAILYTLNVLLNKIPQFLKPFLPQLQRTFAKSLSDPSNEVLRTRAAKALGTLITLQARIDPLVTELISGAKSSTDEGVIAAMHHALAEIVTKAGGNLSAASRSSLIVFVNEQVPKTNDAKKLVILATCLGGVVAHLDDEEAGKIIKGLVHDESKFALLAMNAVLKFSGSKIEEVGAVKDVRDYLVAKTDSDSESSFSTDNAVLGLGKLALGLSIESNEPESVVEALANCMVKSDSRSPDTRRLSLVIVRTLARAKYDSLIKPYLDLLVLPIFGCVRDTIIPVKLAAEKCYLAVLNLVEEQDQGTPTFETWIKHAADAGLFQGQQQRSVGDYTKRVAMRLAASVKDRIEAGGDDEQVLSDEVEDENEIWSIGSFELS